LKPEREALRKDLTKSHPVRVRGLKLAWSILAGSKLAVAPRAGAWIETSFRC